MEEGKEGWDGEGRKRGREGIRGEKRDGNLLVLLSVVS